LIGHEDYVCTVAFNSDGTKFVAGDISRIVKIWNIDTREELLSLTDNLSAVQAVAYSPLDDLVIPGSSDQMIGVSDVSSILSKKVSKSKGGYTCNDKVVVPISRNGERRRRRRNIASSSSYC
jgi:WD40 repeat protein